MVGLERGTVELEPHRSEWKARYVAEVDRLDDVVGNRVRRFEHVGSTAIEGLPAKPVIDVLALVDSFETARDLVPVLEAAGYYHRPKDDVNDRIFLAKGSETDRTHYLSLTPSGSDTHCEQTAFRDHLRANREIASEYGDLKRDLAARYPDDRASYTAEKSDFVGSVLEDALEE